MSRPFPLALAAATALLLTSCAAHPAPRPTPPSDAPAARATAPSAPRPSGDEQAGVRSGGPGSDGSRGGSRVPGAGPGEASGPGAPAARPPGRTTQGPRRHARPPAYRRWGLAAPLARAPENPDRPPAPRAVRPGLPPVVDRVATRDKVVFLTYDDGAEKDPRFVRMVRELRLPVSMFLTDSVVGPGYGHFARLRAVGATVQNHTLDHIALRGLPYAGQRAEICGQQDKLKQRFGIRPTLFRPPYGVYDTTTLRAAADCGIAAVVLWRVSAQHTGLRHAAGERLRPGDIVHAHFTGPDPRNGTTLTGMTTGLLRRIQEQGLTVGRLEDYLPGAEPRGNPGSRTTPRGRN